MHLQLCCLGVVAIVVLMVTSFALGFFDPKMTASTRPVRLNKTDGGYGLELDWDKIVGVRVCVDICKYLFFESIYISKNIKEYFRAFKRRVSNLENRKGIEISGKKHRISDRTGRSG